MYSTSYAADGRGAPRPTYGGGPSAAPSNYGPTPSSANAMLTPQKERYATWEDDEDDEDGPYPRISRGHTPDGYYEDFYGQYAQMGTTGLHDSASQYRKTMGYGIGDDTEATDIGGYSLHRDPSNSDRTTRTATSSRNDGGGGHRTKGSGGGGVQDLPYGFGSRDGGGGTLHKSTSSKQMSISTTANKTRHQRGIPSTAVPFSSPASRTFGWIPATWPARLFILITVAEAAADISIEAVLLSRFRQSQGSISANGGTLAALPVFLMVFGMAHLYQVFLALDATVNRNTILVFGLVLFNIAFFVYALIQITEIRNVLGDGVIPGTSQVVPVQVLTGAIPVIIGVASLLFLILAYFLWKEFGWQIYKTIGADRRLKRAHLHFQIFVCLLKFDFFTFIAYCLQLVLVVLQRDTVEFWVTTCATPVALVLLIFAWFSVRMEWKWGTFACMTGMWGGAGYFAYKLLRIWQKNTTLYKDVYKSLTVFSVLAICLLLATFAMTIRCLMNFDMGLKAAMTRSAQERKALKEDDLGSHAGHGAAAAWQHDAAISLPFQYEMNTSPHYPYNGQGSAAMSQSPGGFGSYGGGQGYPSFPQATAMASQPSGHSVSRLQDSNEADQYYEPYGQAQQYASHSTSGLLSPTKSPPPRMPSKGSNHLQVDRSATQSHRLSLD